MIKNLIKQHYIEIVSVLFAGLLMLWAIGCQPKVSSMIDPTVKITRADLQTEIEILIAIYQRKNAQLEQQEKLRKLITENALLIASTGAINPLGILTGLAAFYGAGTAANNTRKVIKSKIKKTTTA